MSFIDSGASFTQKLISVTITLAQNPGTNQPSSFAGVTNEFGVTVSANQVMLEDSRTSVRIYNSGASVDCRASVKIWGLTPNLTNQLSTLGSVYSIIPKNLITIAAGDAINGLSTVFSGTIMNAYLDAESQPDVPFIFDCNFLLAQLAAPVTVSTFQGWTSVATIMSGFARQMGMGFVNAGVTGQLKNPYFPGTIKQQIDACAEHAGIRVAFNQPGAGGINTMTIYPKGGGISGITTPIISPQFGMIGYPAFTQQGIIVKTLFNPLIGMGGQVQVQSSLLSGTLSAQQSANASFKNPSNNIWAVSKVDHSLDSLVRNGQWMSSVNLFNPNYPRTIPAPTGS